jgi:hypothetical protein
MLRNVRTSQVDKDRQSCKGVENDDEVRSGRQARDCGRRSSACKTIVNLGNMSRTAMLLTRIGLSQQQNYGAIGNLGRSLITHREPMQTAMAIRMGTTAARRSRKSLLKRLQPASLQM